MAGARADDRGLAPERPSAARNLAATPPEEAGRPRDDSDHLQREECRHDEEEDVDDDLNRGVRLGQSDHQCNGDQSGADGAPDPAFGVSSPRSKCHRDNRYPRRAIGDMLLASPLSPQFARASDLRRVPSSITVLSGPRRCLPRKRPTYRHRQSLPPPRRQDRRMLLSQRHPRCPPRSPGHSPATGCRPGRGAAARSTASEHLSRSRPCRTWGGTAIPSAWPRWC